MLGGSLLSSDPADRQRELGQFLTPKPVADLMASLFATRWHELDLLDAGAGAGALSAVLIRQICGSPHRPGRISITAYELDKALILLCQVAQTARENEMC